MRSSVRHRSLWFCKGLVLSLFISHCSECLPYDLASSHLLHLRQDTALLDQASRMLWFPLRVRSHSLYQPCNTKASSAISCQNTLNGFAMALPSWENPGPWFRILLNKPKFVSASYLYPGIPSLYYLLKIYTLLYSVQNQWQSQLHSVH